MATLQQVVQLVFEGVDNASQTAEKVTKSIADLNSSVGDVTKPFADLSDSLSLVQGALLAVAGVVGTLAYKEAVDFETSLVSLQKQMEENEGSARDFSGVLEALAVKYGINANELVKSAADFKAAGFDLETSTKLVEASLKLVIAGGVDAGAAVDIMNRSLAGFNVDSKDAVAAATKIGDILNKTADITKSSFTELALGFSDLSPIAKLTGLSFEETAAFLSKVIDVFGSGSEAARGLSSGFLSILNPSDAAAKALEGLGVKFKASGQAIGTIKEILESIGPSFQKLDESQKLYTAGLIFGKDQAGRMVVALGEYSAAMDLAKKITGEAAGSIDKEVNLRLKSAQAVINSTNESWRQLLRVLGDEIRIETTGVISSLGDLGLALKKAVEGGALDKLFGLLTPQLENLENLFRTVASNLPAVLEDIDFSGLVRALENLGVNAKKALEALLGPIDLTTVDGLKNAIQEVIDVLSGLTNVASGQLGGLAPLLTTIRELATTFKDATPEAQSFFGELLGFSKSANVISGALEPINTALLAFVAFGPKLAGFAAGAGGVVAALAGPQGLAVILGVATSEIIKFLIPAEKLADYAWPDWLAGYSGATPGTALADIADGFVALKKDMESWLGISDEIQKPIVIKSPVTSFDGAISEIARYERAINDSEKEYTDLINFLAKPVPVNSWDGILAQLSRIDKQTNDTNDSTKKYIGTLEGLPELKLPDNVKVEQYRTSITGVVAANGALVTSYSSIGDKTVKATGAFAAVSTAAEDNAKKVDEATKKAESFLIKMEEIASNERIKTIEAYVSLNVADLEAQTKQVEAAFESINTTINSTGDLLGSLFGALGNADAFTRLEIIEQIEAENRRRDAALELQKELTQAEIESIRAKTRALDRGDSILKIDGTGLAPQLEAFMWEILKAIRIRANADFADYLLGVATT